jgi:hypothetical protein
VLFLFPSDRDVREPWPAADALLRERKLSCTGLRLAKVESGPTKRKVTVFHFVSLEAYPCQYFAEDTCLQPDFLEAKRDPLW